VLRGDVHGLLHILTQPVIGITDFHGSPAQNV
jgi:hypothetical protein